MLKSVIVTSTLFTNLIFYRADSEEVVCPGLDLRSDLGDSLRIYKLMSSVNKTLDKCTVIEGNVQLLLLGPANFRNKSEYGALRFSRLREITGYLLIFEFSTLSSVGDLFPELRIIRGLQLVQNYALIVFRNPDLREIGLTKLQEISRGGVRISKNPSLCYVDTINWALINKRGALFIDGNGPANLCRACESPLIENSGCAKLNAGNDSACWNRESCQKSCPENCKKLNLSCSDSPHDAAFCCHDQCAAVGCTGPGPGQCYACRNVAFNGTCQKSCPPGYFKYLERRCVTAAQCRSYKTVFDHHEHNLTSLYPNDDDNTVYYKPIELSRTCSPVCPADYEEDADDRHTCRRCSDAGCRKVCYPESLLTEGIINSASDAKRLHGCTIIKGYLDVTIHSLLPEFHLQLISDSLSRITEVTSYVKISFAKSLVSLDFLQSTP